MNLNSRIFAAHNHQHRQPTIGYRSPSHPQHGAVTNTMRSSFERTNRYESFLPTVTTRHGSMDGPKPFYRNDFANNDLFVAKQKLASILHNQTTMNMHLYDRNESKQKTPRSTTKYKQQKNLSHMKSNSNGQLTVVNLVLQPSLPSSYRRPRTIRLQSNSSQLPIGWTNPVLEQYHQSILHHKIDEDVKTNTNVNELIDNNPVQSSLLYVKSILSPTES
ncbi:hypothetical protein I4U23_025596 [Adineta vaga]|nr:hypothetical protein I4U23_025596 [Adineta vaga]